MPTKFNVDATEILARLEKLEGDFLAGAQEVHALKLEIQKQANNNPRLETLLGAEQVAKILGVDSGYVYAQARANKIPSVRLGKYRRFCSAQLKNGSTEKLALDASF